MKEGSYSHLKLDNFTLFRSDFGVFRSTPLSGNRISVKDVMPTPPSNNEGSIPSGSPIIATNYRAPLGDITNKSNHGVFRGTNLSGNRMSIKETATSTNYRAPLSDISNKFIQDSKNPGKKDPRTVSGCTTVNQEIIVNHSKRFESTVKSSMSLRLFKGMDDGTDFDSAENFTIADFQAEEGELY
ncbi:uncharacterized protein LOC141698675 isoform X2 [Apium graveolens]|uniref:uncharacterized protein LOC141698675 isoform X2 n=1 Tax=Apium graveolens TaxID=4045 RepID=UPI003D79B66D